MGYKRKSVNNRSRKQQTAEKNNKQNDKVDVQNRFKDLKSKFKLKDLSIILHDIAIKKIILPHQELVNNENADPINEINKCQQYEGNKNCSKKKESSINNTIKNKCSKKKSINRNSLKKQIKKKQEKNDDLIREPCVLKKAKISLISDINDNMKENGCQVKNGIEWNKTKYPVILEQAVQELNPAKGKAGEQDLNFNDNSKENIVAKEHCVKDSVQQKQLPRIKEDNILPKNALTLLKFGNVIKVSNNLLDTAYSTNTALQKENNEHVSDEADNNVVDLTVENLHKFINNYNEYFLLKRNDFCSKITRKDGFSTNSLVSNDSINLSLRKIQGKQYAPHKRRSWIKCKENVESDETNIKKIKLDRRCFKENGVTNINNSMYSTYIKKSTLFSNCNSQNIVHNYKIQNADNYLTLYSDDGNNSCKIQCIQESTKTDLDIIFKDKHITETNISNNLNIKFGKINEKKELSSISDHDPDARNINEDNLNESKKSQPSSSNQLTCQEQVKNDMRDNFHDNDYDDDCISLYAESFISCDETNVTCNENKVENTQLSHNMTETIFNNYFQQNISECNTAFVNSEEYCNLENKIFLKSYKAEYEEMQENNILPVEKFLSDHPDFDSFNTIQVNNNNSLCCNKNNDICKENITSNNQVAMTNTNRENLIDYYMLYKSFCVWKMAWGFCRKTECPFEHKLQKLTELFIYHKQSLTDTVNDMCSRNYYYLLQCLHIESLETCSVAFIMDTYRKLYSREHVRPNITRATIEALLKKGMDLRVLVDTFCDIFTPTDIYTSRCVLDTIINKIEFGEYWNILHKLFIYTEPRKEIIECILNECIVTSKYVQDVYKNLIMKLEPGKVNELNSDIMSSFNDLLMKESQKCSNDKTLTWLSNSTSSNERSSEKLYMLHSLSDLPNPQSQYRDRFWKLYLMLYNIKEALLHEDYDYVISILEIYQEDTQHETLFSRACFKILCTEIKHSEYYISKIIEHAVHVGASSVLYKVLLDVAKYVLLKLIIEEAWILAYKLLKSLQIYDVHYNATFIILAAEIYLANKHAIKALMLLRRSNIISLNREKWKVISNPRDSYLRVNLIHNLLDVLSVESPEHAFFVFQYLIRDQPNNFQPINLTYYIDKLMLTFVKKKEMDLIDKMGYIIVKNDFTLLNKTIFRAAIRSSVHSDITLAKQLYQYASDFGVYNITEILPVTRVIINLDWVEEEIYLVFLDLFKRYAAEIGHSIDRFNPNNLTIYIVFQAIPTEAHLIYENVKSEQDKRIGISKHLVREVLRKRFEPPIKLSKKTNGPIMKLQNKSVLYYLKSLHEDRV